MRTGFYLLLFLLMASVGFEARAESSEQRWVLPVPLSDNNTNISFEVDSTWVLVKGKTSDVVGELKSAGTEQRPTISILLTLPVAKFDTNSSGRDEHLMEVMAAERFPQVKFAGDLLEQDCPRQLVVEQGFCDTKITGLLTIRESSLPISIPTRVVRADGGFLVTGSVPLRWADYGIEDPSILIAKLDEVAVVNFEIKLES